MSTSPSFDLGAVDTFTAGTVGAPGQRVFFLQARADGQVVTVKCEKQQVAALGQYLERLLQDLPAPGDGPLPTALELLDPVDAVWVAGRLSVDWQADADRFVVEVEELDPEALEAVEDDRRRTRGTTPRMTGTTTARPVSGPIPSTGWSRSTAAG